MELAAMETAAAEALIFSRSAAIAGSLWAWWLAAMAAVVGLWRFRSAAVASKPAAAVAIPAVAVLPPPKKSDADVAADRTEALVLPHAQPAAERLRLSDDDDCFCTPKGRFTSYFHADSNEGEAAEEKASGDEVDWQAAAAEEEEATEVRSKRDVDMGWYRYQDRAALNGSVVRLWDGGRRLTAAAAPPPLLGRRAAGKLVLRGKTGMCF